MNRIEKIKKTVNTIKQGKKEFEREVREKTLSYIIAALGLVAGLAWNEAIKGLIEYFFPMNANTILAKCVYAIIITLIVVFVSVYLTHLLKKKEENT
ncbi:hypothetical protein HYV57_01510 [Candidatus Peregrinibacteria bacterium]|nr:hypothetical protein [Candidatus Peregrinibacteria bacterium]